MKWNPEQYLKFSVKRARPAADLLAQLRADNARLIVDLGCGTGALSKILAERWHGARVIGPDKDEAAEFERRLAPGLAAAHPERAGVTRFPMSQIFFVATRDGS